MKKNELSKLKAKQLKQTETAKYKKTFQSLNKDVPNNKRKGGKHQPYKSTRKANGTAMSYLNTAIVGKIGENRVENHLLENGYQVFSPSADTWGIDFVCFKPKLWNNEWKINLITIQVKYHTRCYNTSFGKSLKVNFTENYADWIAVPIDRGFVDDYEHIIYYPNEKKGVRHAREFSFKDNSTLMPTHKKYKNQHPRRWAKYWYDLPTPRPKGGWDKLIKSKLKFD